MSRQLTGWLLLAWVGGLVTLTAWLAQRDGGVDGWLLGVVLLAVTATGAAVVADVRRGRTAAQVRRVDELSGPRP